MRRTCAVAIIVLLLAAGCGQEPEEGQETPKQTEEATPTETGAAVLPIQVDGLSDAREVGFNAFFPKEITARPGDTLRFKQVYTGTPHNVTFGSIVDAGIASMERAGPNVQAEPPEMQKVRDIFGPPPSFMPLNQSAAQPCFLDSGDPPAVNACTKRSQPDFNGRQSWYTSGYIQAEGTFDVKLADDIEPGTYSFVCAVHRAPMSGKVAVVEQDVSRPGPGAVQRRGRNELQQAVQAFKPALDQAAAATPDKAFAGALSQDVPNGEGLVFGPRQVSIPTGGSVSWSVLAFHTISINPPPDAYNILIKAADGTVQANPKLGAPSKTRAGPVLFPPGPGVRATTFDAGEYDGTGFFNSGLVASFPPGVLTYKVTFTKPGTYELRCLIHPDMKGTVKVG
jgi:plastocyanin